MPKIEGFRVKNYRVLKDVTLGKLWNTPKAKALTSLTAVIGKNGVGKSSLFDAFGFLADCLKLGVEEACDTRGRGGFEAFVRKAKTARSSSSSTTDKRRPQGPSPTNWPSRAMVRGVLAWRGNG